MHCGPFWLRPASSFWSRSNANCIGVYRNILNLKKDCTMPSTCCVIGCNSRSHREGIKVEGVGFYCFPTLKKDDSLPRLSEVTKRRRMAWIAAVRRPDFTFEEKIPSHMKVCSRHFHKGKPAYELLECDADWAPSLNLGHAEVKASNVERSRRQYSRAKRQQAREAAASSKEGPPPTPDHDAEMVGPPPAPDHTYHQAELVAAGLSLEHTEPVGDMDAAVQSPRVDGATQNDAGEQQDCSLCKARVAEINRLLEENRVLKAELAGRNMDENAVNDDRVRSYTGLPCLRLFMALLTTILPDLPKGTTGRKMTHFQILLMTLMRLRLNLPLHLLAHIFNISRQHASNIFCDTIQVLHAHLNCLVHWPEKHDMQYSMPHQFVEQYENRVKVIIDCFELFIEKPQNPLALGQTYSQYKHRHTMKYLIGICPQGSICFISKGWGGQASDKLIAENSGFLQKLEGGDIVLADRGFKLKECVAFVGATLKIPASAMGSSQMTAEDIETSSKLSSIRIHIERSIGCVRSKYTILNNTIPLNLVLPLEGEDLTLLDKIVVVSCALTNMCQSMVV